MVGNGQHGPILIYKRQLPREVSIAAIRTLAPHSAEYLINVLKAQESPLRRIYRSLYSAMPLVMKNMLPLLDDSEREQSDAIAALAELGKAGKPAIPVLVQKIIDPKDNRFMLKSQLLQVLERLQPETATLDQMIYEFCSQTRFTQAQEVLDRFSLRTPAAAAAVVKMLESGEESDRNWACRYVDKRLRSNGKPVVPLLIKDLSSDDKEIRYLSARTLGAIGTNAAEAIPALTKALEDPYPIVQSAAAKSLKAIKSQETVP